LHNILSFNVMFDNFFSISCVNVMSGSLSRVQFVLNSYLQSLYNRLLFILLKRIIKYIKYILFLTRNKKYIQTINGMHLNSISNLSNFIESQTYHWVQMHTIYCLSVHNLSIHYISPLKLNFFYESKDSLRNKFYQSFKLDFSAL
jgi:hypothetical protein